MNTEQKLRRLLTEAAGTYHPEPAGGRGRRLTTAPLSWRILAGFLAAVVAIAAIGFVIANGHHGNGGSRSSSASRSSSSGLERSAGSSGGGASAATSDAVAAPAAGAAKSAPSAAGSGAGTSAGIAVRNARVVQTGQLELAVRKGGLRAALDRLDSIAAADGGYIAGSQANEDTTGDSVPSGSSTVRVPIDRFAAVMAKARALGKVLSSSSSARDVTGQYVDLGARISALSDTRATYLTLLSRATSIGDTLAVQQQVQQVQSQLEQLQGQQKVLADSSDLATLTVSLSEAGTAAPPVKPARATGFSKALRSAGHNFNVGLQAIITVAGPIALAALVVGFLAGLALLARRLHRRYVGGSFR